MPGDAGNRSLKFSFTVDQQSLLQTKNAIKDLTEEVKKLANELARAGSSMGGMQGSRNPFFAGVSGKPSGQPGGSPGGQSAGGKIGIDSGVSSVARDLKDTARASIDALRDMSGAVRSNISGQVSEIERLKRALKELNQMYISASSPGEVAGIDAVAGTARDSIIRNQKARNDRGIEDRLYDNPDQRVQPPSGYKPDAISEKAPSNFMATVGYLQKGLGAAGAAWGGFKHGWESGLQSIQRDDVSQFNAERYGGTGGMWDMQNRARQARVGVIALNAKNDLSTAYFADKAFSDKKLVNRLSDTFNRNEEAKINAQFDTGSLSTMMNNAGRGLRNLGGHLFGLDSSDMLAGFESNAYDKAAQAIPADVTDDILKYAAAQQASDPFFTERLERFRGEAGTRVANSRLGGLGGGKIKKGVYKNYDSYDIRQANLVGHGRDTAQLAASYRSLGQTAGWGNRDKMGETGISMAEGGFQGVEQMFNVGQQIGGGATGQSFLKSIQSSIGSGGADVTAASSLFNFMGQRAMASGQMVGGDITPALRAFAAATSTGSAQGDMTREGMLRTGLDSWGNVLSGGLDPLQGALNVAAANKAMPGMSWGAKEAMTKLGPEALASMLHGGKMTSEMENLGLNSEDVKRYAYESSKQTFARTLVNGVFNPGTAAYNAATGVQAMGGDWKKWLAGQSNRTGAVSALGSVLAQGNKWSQKQGEGDIWAQIAADPAFTKLITSGQGASAPKMSERDRAYYAGQKQVLLDQAGEDIPGEGPANKTNADAAGIRKRLAEEAKAAAAKAGRGGGEATMEVFVKDLGHYTDKLGVYTAKMEIIVHNTETIVKALPKR